MQRQARIRWAAEVNVNASLEGLKANIKASLRAIYASIHTPFVVYDMQGDQGAQTTVQTVNAGARVFSTTDNMHSEMMALASMLSPGQWSLTYGTVENQGAAILPAAFTTTQPHCGFCTIMLAVLQLPLTHPTRGNYNLAVNYNYPVPPKIQGDCFVLVKLVHSGAYTHASLKQLLNIFFSFQANEWVLQVTPTLLVDDNGEVTPANVGARVVIPLEDISDHTNSFRPVWSYIWRCLYDVNRE